MGYFFKFSPVVNLFRRFSQGLVNDTLNLKFHNFAQVKVKIPCLGDPRAIAKILQVADDEIKTFEKKLLREPEVLAWDYEEGDLTIKTYAWLKDLDFAVIMKKYPDGKRRLITSFYVDKFYKQKDFERKYTNRIK